MHGFGHLYESRLAMQRDQGKLSPFGRRDHRVGELVPVQNPQLHRDRGDLLLVKVADEAALRLRLETDSESVVEDELAASQQAADLRNVQNVRPPHLAIEMALAAHHLGQPPAHDRKLEDIGHG